MGNASLFELTNLNGRVGERKKEKKDEKREKGEALTNDRQNQVTHTQKQKQTNEFIVTFKTSFVGQGTRVGGGSTPRYTNILCSANVYIYTNIQF